MIKAVHSGLAGPEENAKHVAAIFDAIYQLTGAFQAAGLKPPLEISVQDDTDARTLEAMVIMWIEATGLQTIAQSPRVTYYKPTDEREIAQALGVKITRPPYPTH